MRLGKLRVSFKLRNQSIVGTRLPNSIPSVERYQKEDGDNGHIIGSGDYFPELTPVHLRTFFESRVEVKG
jgi:hypothetical protein